MLVGVLKSLRNQIAVSYFCYLGSKCGKLIVTKKGLSD
jgi:hypothetical protein